jgi:UDP-GlcNAc:undecaprenyl-phosphate/decaprenyl-phosphate GlcNAc-1-phosphate transferase
MNLPILPFLISLGLTILAIPFTIAFAKRFKLLDDPNLRPHPAHIQKRVVPRAGGLPIFVGILVTTLLFIPFNKAVLGILLAVFLLLIIGLLDDAIHNLSPYPRLIFQVIAALIVVASGIGISFITNPFGGILRLDSIVIPFYLFGEHSIILIADLFALVWIIWMMNMVNWSKGVDGQMPSIMTVAFITIGFISYRFYTQGDPNQLPIAILSFISAGASLGFLIFNWHPARIFPAFSGSTILGFMLAVLSILSGAKLAIALLVLLVPAIDFFYTLLRRVLTGSSPFFGDQKHLHHLLLHKGWSHPQISLFYLACSVILGLLATNLSSTQKIFTVISGGVIITGAILWLHLFSKKESDA